MSRFKVGDRVYCAYCNLRISDGTLSEKNSPYGTILEISDELLTIQFDGDRYSVNRRADKDLRKLTKLERALK